MSYYETDDNDEEDKTPPPPLPKKKRQPKKKRDPDIPKGALTANLLYVNSNQARAKEEVSDTISFFLFTHFVPKNPFLSHPYIQLVILEPRLEVW